MSGWKSVAAMEIRYSRLELAAAIGRPYDYPAACEELSAILRLAYSKLPKSLQSLVLTDTLAAFRRLPEVQTSHAMSSATLLFQAADATLPKQKRTLAISEFKHAAVAHKRHCKTQYDGGSVQLPQDVIVDIFGFLDMRSLATASLVCWAWNSAASDNMLWQSQYSRLFGKYDICGSIEQTQDNNDVVLHQNIQNADPMSGVCWREAFKKKYLADPFTSKRVLCGHCASILWLSSITSGSTHYCLKHEREKRKIKPVSSDVIVKYLLGQTSSMMVFSDSDSDSDSDVPTSGSVFWAYVDYSSTAED